eukprot:6212883-Pleurochrysis_carterae.AAC.3
MDILGGTQGMGYTAPGRAVYPILRGGKAGRERLSAVRLQWIFPHEGSHRTRNGCEYQSSTAVRTLQPILSQARVSARKT